MELSADEIETVKNLIKDWGFDYAPTADMAKVGALAAKLGLEKIAEEYLRP